MQLLPVKPYHFNEAGIKKIEKSYDAKYMGHWCLKDRRGNWNETPVDVFYQANPDVSKGHSEYFGMYLSGDGGVYITNAKSAFSEPIVGIVCPDDQILVSRYRHDYAVHDGYFIDGGRDYLRMGGNTVPKESDLVDISVKDGEFVFNRR